MPQPTTDRPQFERTWALDDIEILSRAKGGDGRTVEAYAAVFDTTAEIRDQHGHYNERIDRSAFNRTLTNNGPSKTMVLYNHGFDMEGDSGGLASVPIGKPVEIKTDNRGLMTVTRYNKSQLADAVLESIKNGDIKAQSFRGGIYRSDPSRIPRAKAGAELPTVTRMELGLSDYGPTPRAYYTDARITAVRSLRDLFQDFASLDEAARSEMIRLLMSATPDDPADITDPDTGPGTDDSRSAHSARLQLRLRARALFEGAIQ